MKTRRTAWIRWGVVPLALAGVLGLLALRPSAPAPGVAPTVRVAREATGPLRAGAARVTFTLPTRVSRAGFPAPQPHAVPGEGALAPAARALVLEAGALRLAVVSVELLLLPEALRDGIRARLQAAAPRQGTALEVVVVATHTHSGPGGFDARVLAGLAGTGWPQEAVERAIEGAAVQAIAQASSRLLPARLEWHTREVVEGLNRTRTDGVPASQRLSVLRVVTEAATDAVVLVAAHPTLAGREGGVLDVDYPGRTALHRGDGVTLVLQGAGGNAAAPANGADGPARAEAFADRLERAAARLVGEAGPIQPAAGGEVREESAIGSEGESRSPVAGALAAAAVAAAPPPSTPVTLGLRRVEVSTPRPDAGRLVPWMVRGFTERALSTLAPRVAEVSLLTLGPVRLLLVPAEVTGPLEPSLLEAARADALVSLADGYLGYAEAAALVDQERGEAHRQLFEASLAERLLDGARLAGASR